MQAMPGTHILDTHIVEYEDTHMEEYEDTHRGHTYSGVLVETSPVSSSMGTHTAVGGHVYRSMRTLDV